MISRDISVQSLAIKRIFLETPSNFLNFFFYGNRFFNPHTGHIHLIYSEKSILSAFFLSIFRMGDYLCDEYGEYLWDGFLDEIGRILGKNGEKS